MATKTIDTEAFVRKITKLDKEYRQILTHIEMLESMKKEKEAEIQALLDSKV